MREVKKEDLDYECSESFLRVGKNEVEKEDNRETGEGNVEECKETNTNKESRMRILIISDLLLRDSATEGDDEERLSERMRVYMYNHNSTNEKGEGGL